MYSYVNSIYYTHISKRYGKRDLVLALSMYFYSDFNSLLKDLFLQKVVFHQNLVQQQFVQWTKSQFEIYSINLSMGGPGDKFRCNGIYVSPQFCRKNVVDRRQWMSTCRVQVNIENLRTNNWYHRSGERKCKKLCYVYFTTPSHPSKPVSWDWHHSFRIT